MFLSWLLSVWFGTPHFGAFGFGFAGEENPGITSRDCNSSTSFWVLASYFSRHVPRSPFFHGKAQLSRFLHLVLVRTDLELCWEGGAVAPLQLPGLPGSTNLSSECAGARADGGSRKGGGRKRGWKAGSWIQGSLRCDPYPSVLLWMPQYENNPITVDPCTASKTQQQWLIKTERVPIPSFVFAQSVSLSVCQCVYTLVFNWSINLCEYLHISEEQARSQASVCAE